MERTHAANERVSTTEQKHMDPNNTNASPRHRPLNLFRVLRGILCLVIYLSSALMVLVYWAPVTAVLLRFFSIHYSRKATSIIFGAWLSLWPFLFEKINETKVVFSGDSVPIERRVLVLANHRTEVDWMYLWNLALRKNHLGYIKYILKSSLMKLPIFGWGFHILEFISVDRKWEADESNIRQMLSTFKELTDPLWLAVFPEGTNFTEQKCVKSQKFAADHGLPILKNALLPKTKGFCACLDELRSSIDAVYDITIGYKHRCPRFMDNAYGVDPSEVHIHVKRILPGDIPTLEKDAADWLIERFRIKDQLLSDFADDGHFPREGTAGDFPILKCSLNVAVTLALTIVCIYLTFFSTVWFKVYVVTSCAYLAAATYLKIRPKPIFGAMKGILCNKKSS